LTALAQLGATITPNGHTLASTYGLFGNFYDEGRSQPTVTTA
jgi:hypothetical protein